MGNTIFIKDRNVCIKPLRNRIEAILKLESPKMPKGCRGFCGYGELFKYVFVQNYKDYLNQYMT